MTGIRSIGGFVGAEAGQTWWLGDKIEGYWDLVANLDGVEHRHL